MRTDWAEVDAHKITREEYADMPEWTDEQIERAEASVAGRVIRPASGTLTKRGRPRSEAQSVHLRLSPDVLSDLRKTGPGWQTRCPRVLGFGDIGTFRSFNLNADSRHVPFGLSTP